MTTRTAARSATAVDAAGLRELLEGPNAPRVIDVRTPAEFESAHIPGSWNVPLDLLREHRGDLAAASSQGARTRAGVPLRRPGHLRSLGGVS